SVIQALYNGDISSHNNDDSSADMALCFHLAFWTGKNYQQMERLWLTSPLGTREKTQKRQDYRARTITNAISQCTEVYQAPNLKTAVKAETPKFISLGSLLSEPEEELSWVVDQL